jgi:hypothetical protein
MAKSDVVVKWRDQEPDEHVVWVLLDGNKNIEGVTSDWKVYERWQGGYESYFVDDPDRELFPEEEKYCEWEIDCDPDNLCDEPATYASWDGQETHRISYLCTQHAQMLNVKMDTDTLYRIDEYGDPLDGEDDIEDLPFLPLPELKQ